MHVNSVCCNFCRTKVSRQLTGIWKTTKERDESMISTPMMDVR